MLKGSFERSLLRFLIGICLHLLIIELGTSVNNRLLDGLASSLQVLALHKLQLSLETFALNVRNQERRDQILNQLIRLISVVLHLVQVLIDRLDLELSLLVRLLRRRVIDGLSDDVLQVRVHRALVHSHQLLVEHILTLAEYLLSLTTT